MFSKIQRLRDSLSKAELAVAEWVLAHPAEAMNATLAQVASAAGTSEPTVIRFCRSVGLGGFRELGLRLAEARSQSQNFLHRDVSPDDSIIEVVTKVLDSSIQALIDSRAQASAMPFENALEKMSTARQLIFAGLGASGVVSMDACQKFFRLGIPCCAVTDTPGILQAAAVASSRDVIIVTSHSGTWPDIIRAVDLAQASEVTVIALTDPSSPLAAKADLVFDFITPEDSSLYTPMNSRLAHLALLDALQVSLALKLGQMAHTHLRNSKAALVR